MISIYGDREAVEKLGSRLRAQRLRRNWTQAHVARMAGISLPPYVRLEKGNGAMSLRTVAKVLGLFGFAERLGEVVPEAEVVTLAELLTPVPKRARTRRPPTSSHGDQPA